jgi:hypothetical protein
MALIDQLKALDDQRAKLIEDAKGAALEKARKAVAELNELGFRYKLTEDAHVSTSKAAKSSRSIPKRRHKDAPCPICNFKTLPMHDGRSHRGQEPKQPFTAAELAGKGLAII